MTQYSMILSRIYKGKLRPYIIACRFDMPISGSIPLDDCDIHTQRVCLGISKEYQHFDAVSELLWRSGRREKFRYVGMDGEIFVYETL